MRNRILQRLEDKKKKKNRSIMFLDQNQDQNQTSDINLNLNNFRDVKNPDLMNALTIGGGTFLGSTGIRNIGTNIKQNKAYKDSYNMYMDQQGGADAFLENFDDLYCVDGTCPLVQNNLERMVGDHDRPDLDWWKDPETGQGPINNWTDYYKDAHGVRSEEEMKKQKRSNILKGGKDALIAGGGSYLLNKALDNTKFGKNLQKKLGMNINLGIFKEQGGVAPYKYNLGGVQNLPGGSMHQIPGSDAVEFTGASHDDGGIMLDNQTEVEGGETMDQVTMAAKGGQRGQTKDYFFSDHLKEGGVSFANQHKEILANGGSQADIDYLAKMQEKKAGRTTDKIQTAKLGGIMKYSNGGTFKASSDKSNRILEILRAQGYEVPDVADLGTENISKNQKYLGSGYYGEKDIKSDENRKDFYERNKSVLNKIDVDGDGTPDIDSWDDYNPKIHTTAFQEGFNTDMMDIFNNDPNLVKAFEEEGYGSDDLKQFGFYTSADTDDDTDIDDHHGEYTWSRRNPLLNKKTIEKEPCKPPVGGCPEAAPNWDQEACECRGESIEKEEEKTVTKKKKDWTNAGLGLGAMIPAVMAFTEKPDYMETPDLTAPGIVKPERVAKQHLDRVDFNDQIARNANDAGAMNKFIETSGGGPANMANKMAAYAQKQQGDREIKAQEAKANIAIGNEENVMDNKRKVYNAEAALDASKFNVDAQTKASMENTRNRMLVDEFNRGADSATKDRKLNAVQYGVNTLASLHRDKLTKQANDNLASAVDGQRGALNRFLSDKGYLTEGSEESSSTSITPGTTTKTKTVVKDGKTYINGVLQEEPKEEVVRRGGWRKLNLKRRRHGKQI